MTPQDVSSLPPFFWALGEGTEPASRRPLAAIGHDGERWLFVDGAGAVWTTAFVGGDSLFVNVSSSAFAQCKGLFAIEWERRASLADDEAGAQAVRLRKAIQQIDPEALRDPTTWWSLILEQMDDGLL